MHSLRDILNSDGRLMADATLPPEAYRAVLAGAVEAFHEASIREAFPVEVLNFGPGAMESRAFKVVDMAAALHGMKGTGGKVDVVDYSIDDQPFYPIWHNVEVPMREQAASTFGNAGLDLFRDAGRNAGQLVVEKENELLIKGLGPLKGLTTATGLQSFGGATWATQGNAWKDLTTALGYMAKKKVPTNMAAALVNPAEKVKLLNTFSNTAEVQLDKLRALFPGGIHQATDVPAGEAYVYAKTPTVVRVRVAQDHTVIPLPRVEEDERMRVRVIPTTHFLRPDGIVKITGVA